jgi:hypothetical protein
VVSPYSDPVLAGYAELLLISKTLRANIKRDGIMRPDGALNPCVEQFKKYKSTELSFLATIFGAQRSEGDEPTDLVAAMAAVQSDQVETLPESTESQD